MTNEELKQYVDVKDKDRFFIVKLSIDENGKKFMQRFSYKISAFELMGLLEYIQMDMINQDHGLSPYPELIKDAKKQIVEED